MDKRLLLEKILNIRFLKTIYYAFKHNKISRKVLLDSQARLIGCTIEQHSGHGNSVFLETGVTLSHCKIVF